MSWKDITESVDGRPTDVIGWNSLRMREWIGHDANSPQAAVSRNEEEAPPTPSATNRRSAAQGELSRLEARTSRVLRPRLRLPAFALFPRECPPR